MAKPAPVTIPTEPIGSIPRSVDLIERIAKADSEDSSLDPLYEDAIRDTIAAGSPVVTDGEPRKYHNFCTHCVLALSRFSAEERRRIGVHTCPGNDFDSTHSADVDYVELLPSLFGLKAGNFYIAMVGERDRRHALKIIRKYRKPDQRVFVGVTAPADPHIETPEEVPDRSFEPGKNWRWC